MSLPIRILDGTAMTETTFENAVDEMVGRLHSILLTIQQGGGEEALYSLQQQLIDLTGELPLGLASIDHGRQRAREVSDDVGRYLADHPPLPGEA